MFTIISCFKELYIKFSITAFVVYIKERAVGHRLCSLLQVEMLLLQALFVFLLFFQKEVYSVEIPCNHSTPVCECDINNLDDGDDVCEFQFDIEMLQTFTRYVLDDNGDSRGTAGSVWHIVNGQWQPVDPEDTSCGTTIGNTECTEPFGVDGYTFRSFIAVNGRIPGPTLIVPQNKLVKVNVINRLASESISIHWHGMHQRGSNWMDGVEHITQCGIPPGASFTYIFEAAQYGTHWYHSHSGAQRTDGLFGALIVKDNQKEALLNDTTIMSMNITDYEDMPDKHTLSLLDWQKTSSLDLFTQIHSGIRYFDIEKAASLSPDAVINRLYSSDGAEIGPVPYWSGLINGKGKHRDGVDYVNSNLSEFKVTAGKTYRFRLIGAQSLYAYRFSIEEHNLTVIATDGQFIEPVTVDYIIIHSGERYDFLLKTKATFSAESEGYFMIRAITLNFTETTTYLEENSTEAILNYNEESTPSSRYSAIAMRSQTVSQRCADHTCKALNCPFKQFPMDYNIECIHINNLTLLTEYSEDLPEIATEDNSRLFFNFAFEGTRQTSAVNARNLKLPSGALALLDTTKLADINKKEYCKGLNDKSKCDRENDREVISPYCYCTHVKTGEAGRSIELVLSAIGPQPTQLNNFLFAHPVHLHGHYFHVLDIQFGTTDENTGKLTAGHSEHIDCGGDILCTVPSWKTRMDYNTRKSNEFQTKISRAPLKDTLIIPAGGYAVVYFKADNPGWWFLHCHIEVHQLEGMGVIINEGGFKTTPPGGMSKCGNFSFTTEEFNKLRNGGSDSSGDGKVSKGYMIATYIFAGTTILLGILSIILGVCLYCAKKDSGYQTIK